MQQFQASYISTFFLVYKVRRMLLSTIGGIVRILSQLKYIKC